MKFTKEVDGKTITIEETRQPIFTLLEREGFKEAVEEEVKKK